MIRFNILFVTIVFLCATAFSFFWFKKTNPEVRFWWLRTPTSHALLFGTIAFLILFLAIPQSNLRQLFLQFVGILLMITGFGFILGSFFISNWLREIFAQRKKIAILVFLTHLGSGIAGIYLVREGFSQTNSLIFPIVIALGYIITVGVGFIRR